METSPLTDTRLSGLELLGNTTSRPQKVDFRFLTFPSAPTFLNFLLDAPFPVLVSDYSLFLVDSNDQCFGTFQICRVALVSIL